MGNPGRPYKNEYKTDTIFSVRMRELMHERDVETKELAIVLRMSREAVGQWRRGVCAPSLPCLAEICDILDVSADYLIGRTDER